MKVLWQESEERWITYNPEIHSQEAWIFIYWDEEELLLVGWPKKFEMQIPQKRFQHLDLYEWSREFAPQRNPDGAGRIYLGKVDSWGSGGFDLFTPESLRPKILGALGIKP